MSYTLQNFYKSTISLDWSIGTGNFYVAVKPTISTGWLVISPNNATTREIIKYTSTGTDANGDYVVVSVRGVGGTTEQTHTVGEPIRMNITAEYWDAMNDDIAAIVASGVSNANTTTMGGVEIATSAEVDAGTETGGTGASLALTPKNVSDSHNIPHVAPGTSGNVMSSNGTDWVSTPAAVIPFISQDVPLVDGVTSTSPSFLTSDATGTVMFYIFSSGSDAFIKRLLKDTVTGNYYMTHEVTLSTNKVATGLAVIGNLLYVSHTNAGANALVRYSTTDLSGVTTVTFSGTSRSGVSWSDGTNLYIYNGTSSQFDKFTISGTVATNAGAITFTSSGTPTTAISNGTNVWISNTGAGTGTYNIRKYAVAGGGVVSTTSPKIYANAFHQGSTNAANQLFIAQTLMLGIGWFFNPNNATAVDGTCVHLTAISLP